eukprot:jgi/Galph1/290/GphlegSOOS_G5129.1
MCQLNVATLDSIVVSAQFEKLARAGVAGVMIDVWWSLCEPTPGHYDFANYRRIFMIAIENNLRIQVVLSFHTCGESEGDEVVIQLPSFVRQVANYHPFVFYTDENGMQSFECLGLSADNAKIFPDKGNIACRSALDMYEDFMNAFAQEFGNLLCKHIVQIQVSMGPSGELRYPSFALSHWKFPGIGAFQCFDEKMQQDYFEEALYSNAANPSLFPCYMKTGEGYNSMPSNTPFFLEPNGLCEKAESKKFLEWYSNKLLLHGERILERACKVFSFWIERQDENEPISSALELGCKIAGIHWWYKTSYRPAEAVAGYYVAEEFNFYEKIVHLLRKYHATFIFTCFEKRDDWEKSFAKCSPESIVKETWSCASRINLPYAAENALEMNYDEEYEEVIRKVSWGADRKYKLSCFTLLRLSSDLSTIGLALGDLIAQSNNLWNGERWDVLRTVRFASFGLFVHGPVSHFWYQFLDRSIVAGAPKSGKAVAAKTMMDQLLWAPVFTSVFFAYLKVAQGDVNGVAPEIEHKLWPTLKVNWLVWPAAHLFNFRFVPDTQRVLYINIIAIGYNAFLSVMAAKEKIPVVVDFSHRETQ